MNGSCEAISVHCYGKLYKNKSDMFLMSFDFIVLYISPFVRTNYIFSE